MTTVKFISTIAFVSLMTVTRSNSLQKAELEVSRTTIDDIISLESCICFYASILVSVLFITCVAAQISWQKPSFIRDTSKPFLQSVKVTTLIEWSTYPYIHIYNCTKERWALFAFSKSGNTVKRDKNQLLQIARILNKLPNQSWKHVSFTYLIKLLYEYKWLQS